LILFGKDDVLSIFYLRRKLNCAAGCASDFYFLFFISLTAAGVNSAIEDMMETAQVGLARYRVPWFSWSGPF
jgi:hypothetical protein